MSFAVEWAELAVRWIHVIAGIAWIGTSFYFNWLNDRLSPPDEPAEGLVGELWSVHGGGFYRAARYDTVPRGVLGRLHWFKWEAYLTWLSGFALLVLVYYLGAEVYLVDPGAASIPSAAAIAIGVGTLVLAWVAYDRACRTPLARRPAILAAVSLAVVALLAWGLLQVLGARAAYLHVGAALGTIMAANVFFVIIPAHEELIAAVERGRRPDPETGAHAAMRSRHNNYLTLPVLFAMISNHYPVTYGHPWAWAVLVGLFFLGAAARHAFNRRNEGRPVAWLLPATALGLIGLGYVTATTRASERVVRGLEGEGVPGFATVREVIVGRCVTCHSAEPAHRLFDAPPAGLAFDTPEQIAAAAERIRAVTVATRVMPLGNLTGMTDEERGLLARWIEAGAPLGDAGR